MVGRSVVVNDDSMMLMIWRLTSFRFVVRSSVPVVAGGEAVVRSPSSFVAVDYQYSLVGAVGMRRRLLHTNLCQCQSRTAVVCDFLAALNWTVRFGVWVVVSSALKARLDDWWRTKLDGKVVVVVVGGWWLCMHAGLYMYIHACTL